MTADHALHDVIYEVAALPRVEQLAKSARRTFIGEHVWSARGQLDELFACNDMQHRAIREALAAQRPGGARTMAREHVLASGRLMEASLDLAAAKTRPPDWLPPAPQDSAWPADSGPAAMSRVDHSFTSHPVLSKTPRKVDPRQGPAARRTSRGAHRGCHNRHRRLGFGTNCTRSVPRRTRRHSRYLGNWRADR